MYALHDWLSALSVANGRARTTLRKQRVRWSRDSLCWTVSEAS